jgi:hypothetical protein
MLWTSSTCRRELGLPQLSARLDKILQPRRCRMPESRSSLVAIVRLVIFCLVSCGMGMGVRAGGCVSGGDVFCCVGDVCVSHALCRGQ